MDDLTFNAMDNLGLMDDHYKFTLITYNSIDT